MTASSAGFMVYYSLPKRGKGKGVQVTISCACFVPKPHTPFEFVPMDTEEMLRAKQKHLLESVHKGLLEYPELEKYYTELLQENKENGSPL